MISTTDNKIDHIVVLGGGSAGFLAASAIAAKLPEVKLTVVRSKKLGVIGVGEGTIPSVVTFLHRFLGLDIHEFNRQVRPSIKLGIRYHWGKRPFFNYAFSPQLTNRPKQLELPKGYYCKEDFEYADLSAALMNFGNACVRNRDGSPQFNSGFAYHLENKTFVDFFERLCDSLKVTKVDAIVDDVEVGPQGVSSLKLDNGQSIEADLFIDCSGFRAELIGKALKEPFIGFDEALFCDRAVVGGWERTNDDHYAPYTLAETMNAGWAWRIEHDELVNRGYVFCSAFLSDDEAIEEFCKKNPKIKQPKVIKFTAGVHQRTWVKNVVAIGNAAGFVEPIEATAIGVVCDAVSRLVRGLSVSNLRLLDLQRDIYNRIQTRHWDKIRDFIAMHYRFNDRLDTSFWQMCRNDVELGNAQELVDYYKHVGPDFGFLSAILKDDIFTAEGYLAMLVGQNVPYERDVQITTEMRRKWQQFKNRIAITAEQGCSMDEYIAFLRQQDESESKDGKPTEFALSQFDFDTDAGELNWH